MIALIYNIIISPLELIIEIIFEFIYRLFGGKQIYCWLVIVSLSIVVNLLTTPLYKYAEELRKKQKVQEQRLSKWVTHIKQNFSGDKRFMMLQTYYRQNNYNPLFMISNSFSLLLQIPFFVAAYHFLAHLAILRGANFGIINDLSQPDGIVNFHGLTINVLPLVMVAVNMMSARLYLASASIQDRIQTYGLSVLFFLLLYHSPAGLVLYWTCNNIFSLVRNYFAKLKNSRKIINFISAESGILITTALFSAGKLNSKLKYLFVLFFLMLCFLPYLLSLKYERILKKSMYTHLCDNTAYFPLVGLCELFLVIMLGLVIPSSVLVSSPIEFIDTHGACPEGFILHSFFYGIGFFIVWGSILYAFLPTKGRIVLEMMLFFISFAGIVNFLFFGRNLGMLNPYLQFETGLDIVRNEKVVNAVVVSVIAFFILLGAYKKWFRNVFLYMISIFIVGASVLFCYNFYRLKDNLAEHHRAGRLSSSGLGDVSLEPFITLSKSGKNIIVLFMDRAVGGYIPYILKERPELQEVFSGFTFYPNTISHAGNTLMGNPPIYGGYEYTPIEINKRNNEKLVDKQNEALLVLPVILHEAGFSNIAIGDPAWANYSAMPDLSVFKDYPYINVANFQHSFVDEVSKELSITARTLRCNERNFFVYSIMKSVPLYFQKILYDKGNYIDSSHGAGTNFGQEADQLKNAIPVNFLSDYGELHYLSKLTDIRADAGNTYTNLHNLFTHDVVNLQLPEYELSGTVNNSNIVPATSSDLDLGTDYKAAHYQCNMRMLLEIGNYCDFLRKNGVYDNTRIIIVGDHGIALGQDPRLLIPDINLDGQMFNTLLFVKDFGISGNVRIDNSFMTVADVPMLVLKNIVENPVNPFTGKLVSSNEKKMYSQIVIGAGRGLPEMHYENTFNFGKRVVQRDGIWYGLLYTVHDDIFQKENWELLSDKELEDFMK